MELLNNIDIQLTILINSVLPHTQFFDYFFSFFSLRGSSIFIWIIVIVAVLILEERKYPGIQKRDIRFLIIFLLSFTTSFITSDFVLKNLIKRSRPLPLSATLSDASSAKWLTQCPKDYSFPSTHATTAFASATILTFFDKKRKWFYYVVAMFISLSRIYLGCHYFFDIIGGGIIGLIISNVILGSVATPESILDKPE